MARILVTGMSGVGKSTALARLAALGHRVVDTDWPGWAEEVVSPEGNRTEQLWLEEPMSALLSSPLEGHLFVSGCVANQGVFYDRFDAVVLLTASSGAMLQRIARRVDNPYGKSLEERRQVLDDLASVEPLLRQSASDVLDAERPIEDVVAALLEVARRVDAGT